MALANYIPNEVVYGTTIRLHFFNGIIICCFAFRIRDYAVEILKSFVRMKILLLCFDSNKCWFMKIIIPACLGTHYLCSFKHARYNLSWIIILYVLRELFPWSIHTRMYYKIGMVIHPSILIYWCFSGYCIVETVLSEILWWYSWHGTHQKQDLIFFSFVMMDDSK